MNFPSPLIQFWAPERLILNPNNPRRHSRAQIKQLARSINKFGFLCPPLIDASGNVIAGDGRVRAALLLGLKLIPVLIADHLSEIQKQAYMIADNRLAEIADWDQPKLEAALAVLQKELFELEVLGFDQHELDRLLADLGGDLGRTDADAAPDAA
jgi:ParB-like chromosome segregation protein Spo0J